MKTKASKNFQRFCSSCFDDSFGATRDGLDVEATLSLVGDERAQAEELVLNALQETSDSRPLIAARVMRLRVASPILKRRLSSGFGPRYEYLRVHAAHALYQIENWGEAADTIIDVLTKTPKTPDSQWTRMMAVESVADFPRDSRCSEILFAAVEDEDDFIGFLAIRSLKNVFTLDATVSALLEILEKTQIKPNRWDPQYLYQRRLTFSELGKATGIKMPSTAMKREENAQHEYPLNGEQMPPLTDDDA